MAAVTGAPNGVEGQAVEKPVGDTAPPLVPGEVTDVAWLVSATAEGRGGGGDSSGLESAQAEPRARRTGSVSGRTSRHAGKATTEGSEDCAAESGHQV